MKNIALFEIYFVSDAISTNFQNSLCLVFGSTTAAYQIEGDWNNDFVTIFSPRELPMYSREMWVNLTYNFIIKLAKLKC